MIEIVYQAHHSVMSDNMRARAQRIVDKVARRLPRVTNALVRFEEDGPTKRVVLELHAPGRTLVADSRSAYLGAALADAGNRLLNQVQRERRDKNKKHVMRSRRLSAAPDDDETTSLTA